MQDQIQAIATNSERAEIILKQIYKVLGGAECDDYNYNQIVYEGLGASIYPQAEQTTTTSHITEKEFDYKKAAHDLIGPLATQYTLLGILHEECTEAKERLNKALQNVESIILSNDESIKISKAALNYTQQHIEQPMLFKQIVHSVIQLLGIRELRKDIEINIHINNQKAFYNNMAIVQSIVQNLIQNAVKYSNPNGKNTLTITINDTYQGVEIIIQDTGIGMHEQRLQQLFNNTVSSDTTVKDSHGFGLYAVAQQVQKLQGTITASSSLGVGSRFTVQLPTLIK